MAIYTNYIGRYGKTHLWKFGETTDAYKRQYVIRADARKNNVKSANNFHYIETSIMASSKPEALLVESTVRRIFELKGYALEKNDHFRTNKKANEVIADYHEALAKAAKVIAIALEA